MTHRLLRMALAVATAAGVLAASPAAASCCPTLDAPIVRAAHHCCCGGDAACEDALSACTMDAGTRLTSAELLAPSARPIAWRIVPVSSGSAPVMLASAVLARGPSHHPPASALLSVSLPLRL